mgnify:CR=1 FL=1
MLRMNPVAMALAMAWGLSPLAVAAQSAEAPDNNKVTQLKEVTVSATRTERRVDNVPNTVTVVPQQQIEESGAHDIKQMFSSEVGVDVRQSAARYSVASSGTGRSGSESINIRGLEGNQVLMIEDGIRIPSSYSFGALATGRGDYIDVDGLKSAEVLRGPASIQFGSDGLAGAVSFRTLDPKDILRRGSDLGGYVRSSYATVDRSWANTAAVAGRDDRWQVMLLGSYRVGHEADNKGSDDSQNANRTTPNPADYNNSYLLGKAILTVNGSNQIGVTMETLRRHQETEVYSSRAVSATSSTSVIDFDANDHIDRDRVSFDHHFVDVNAPWIQRADTKVYWQGAKVNQYGYEDRYTAADRTRVSTYEQDIVGISSQLESNFTGLVNQRVTYGFDWSQQQISAVRDGTVASVGDTFPSKPFPDTDYTLLGAFAQSEIEMGAFSIIPGLRFDHYKLDGSSRGYSGTVSRLSDEAVTPRLGVVWRLMPTVMPYAQWAKGFRAPTPDQVNNAFSNPTYGYTSIGNPNLKAERANSIELGLRGKVDTLRYSTAVFDNRYDNFISQQVVSGAGTTADPLVYQYINLAKAHIWGAEARSEWAVTPQWTASAGVAYAKGTTEESGVSTPLDTISPLKLVVGARYDAGEWGARVNVTHAAAKDKEDLSASTYYAPPEYTVVDVGVTWKPMRNLSVNANVNNLLDAKYWIWSDVRGLADTSAVKDAYTAAGRNFQVAVRYDF